MTINSKKKGNKGENNFSKLLRENGFKAFRDSASGGATHKSDIVNGMDYSMEVKTVKRINLQEAWRQVNRDASIAHNAPLLAIHFDGMPEKEWIVCISSSDWIEMEKIIRQTPKNEPQLMKITYSDKTVKYRTQRAISELKELIKILENGN